MCRKSRNDMKTIGIADFKKLVMERLANPRDYAGRSLVLWNADYMNYGIAYRVIEQCCERYNEENPNDQVWFRRSDMTFTIDDYTKSETIRTWYVRDENTQEYDMETKVQCTQTAKEVHRRASEMGHKCYRDKVKVPLYHSLHTEL